MSEADDRIEKMRQWGEARQMAEFDRRRAGLASRQAAYTQGLQVFSWVLVAAVVVIGLIVVLAFLFPLASDQLTPCEEAQLAKAELPKDCP